MPSPGDQPVPPSRPLSRAERWLSTLLAIGAGVGAAGALLISARLLPESLGTDHLGTGIAAALAYLVAFALMIVAARSAHAAWTGNRSRWTEWTEAAVTHSEGHFPD